ncbi:hypothetical protein [Buttiauxella sp.]|uniref:hypothetical protein n=1 Tax=Buttiauxella sp. TaxID=1972222 RepID=UPI003C758CC4
MKLYKAIIIPALLLSAICSAVAGDTENNIAHDYMTHWNEVMDGQSTPVSETASLDSEIVAACKTVAPEQFRNEIIHQWEHKTGSKMTQTAFLSEDLQLFDRLAAVSCIEGAKYQHQKNGDLLLKILSEQLLGMDTKNGNDAWEQNKTMEFRTGMMTARYGISLEKNRF